MTNISRRRFIQGGAMGMAASLASIPGLPPVAYAETTGLGKIVQFSDEMEPIVRLIEDTPRNEIIETIAGRIRSGLTYKQFLGALFLAGIRNVSPQPPGFKFHCVFIIHSCNYLARMSPPQERWLPLFYALDDFKKAQADDERKGDFVLREQTGKLPSGDRAWQELTAAMNDWDEERADRAIVSLARSEKLETIFEGLWEYGARDYRNIGHKMIFVAHALRTLEEIGTQHAEPTLRSLMLGLLDFGKDEVVNDYAFEDQSYRISEGLIGARLDKLPEGWTGTAPNEAVTKEVMAGMRSGDLSAVCTLAADAVGDGKCSAQAIWDAVHLMGGELMMRQPGIAGIHTVTSANSMQYAFRRTNNPRTKFLTMLQGVGWITQFRNLMLPSNDSGASILDLEGATLGGDQSESLEAIFANIPHERPAASAMALSYGRKFGESEAYFDRGRHLVFMKASEHHMYKWPAALYENYHHVTPKYRPHMLATSVYYLPGTDQRDSRVIQRAVEAMKVG